MNGFISYKAHHKFPGRAGLELLSVFVEYNCGHRLRQESREVSGEVRNEHPVSSEST